MATTLAELLHGVPVTLPEVDRVGDALLLEPRWRGPQFLRFTILLLRASAIASFGLLGDSVIR